MVSVKKHLKAMASVSSLSDRITLTEQQRVQASTLFLFGEPGYTSVCLLNAETACLSYQPRSP